MLSLYIQRMQQCNFIQYLILISCCVTYSSKKEGRLPADSLLYSWIPEFNPNPNYNNFQLVD